MEDYQLECCGKVWDYRRLDLEFKSAESSGESVSATSQSSSDHYARCAIKDEGVSPLIEQAAQQHYCTQDCPTSWESLDDDLRLDNQHKYKSYAADLITQAAGECRELASSMVKELEPTVFLDKDQMLRLAYDQIVVRFSSTVCERNRDRILNAFGLKIRAASINSKNQWIAYHPRGDLQGRELFRVANCLANEPDVAFAEPYFVSEYFRACPLTLNIDRSDKLWHLKQPQVDVLRAHMGQTKGDKNVIVAILDDGVDIRHPNLKGRCIEEHARDFTVHVIDGGRPNRSPNNGSPYGGISNEDYHGTLCAGVIISDGTQENYVGVAPKCSFFPVKIWDGPKLMPDPIVADAIVYASRYAQILCCAWDGGHGLTLGGALQVAANGRNGKGIPVFCATGNQGRNEVGFPAAHATTIGVGACTPEGNRNSTWNYGPGDDNERGIDIVAPSKGNDLAIWTTDLSGFRGKSAGNFYHNFGGTSAATAIAAGVGALCLSVNPNLAAEELRTVLRETAKELGPQSEFGDGRVSAFDAIAEAEHLIR